MPGDHHYDRTWGFVAQAGQHVQSIHAGHLHVEEDHIRMVGCRSQQPIRTVLGRPHLMSFILENLDERFADAFFVVDDQKPRH